MQSSACWCDLQPVIWNVPLRHILKLMGLSKIITTVIELRNHFFFFPCLSFFGLSSTPLSSPSHLIVIIEPKGISLFGSVISVFFLRPRFLAMTVYGVIGNFWNNSLISMFKLVVAVKVFVDTLMSSNSGNVRVFLVSVLVMMAVFTNLKPRIL